MLAAYEVNKNTALKNNTNVAKRMGIECTAIDIPVDKRAFLRFKFSEKMTADLSISTMRSMECMSIDISRELKS